MMEYFLRKPVISKSFQRGKISFFYIPCRGFQTFNLASKVKNNFFDFYQTKTLNLNFRLLALCAKSYAKILKTNCTKSPMLIQILFNLKIQIKNSPIFWQQFAKCIHIRQITRLTNGHINQNH